jgi:small GTP-binding protein
VTGTASLPVIAIVGRPNVGKSTLFNRVVGDGRAAIVEDRARTTRDRIYGEGEWNGRRFLVVDTGGLEAAPGDAIEERVQDQARIAIAEAQVIVFVVDATSGLTPADQEAAETLRRATAPVFVAVNKADNARRELDAAEFWALGWDATWPISAAHGRGVADLLDEIVIALPPESEAEVARKAREIAADREADLIADELVEGLTAQDAHVAGYTIDAGKGLVIAVNKWDLVEGKTDRTFDQYVSWIRRETPFLSFAPVVSISAKTGQRVERVLEMAVDVWGERRKRIGTGELNRLLAEATARQVPPAAKNRRPRLYYATQAAIEPPTFIFFANDAELIHFSYRRYLENRIRDVLGFNGTPIKLVFRNRGADRPPRKRSASRSGGARAGGARRR